MSNVMSIYDAKSQFSKLVYRAEQGEEILIARHGKIVARISSAPEHDPRLRRSGLFKGIIQGDPLGPTLDDDEDWG